MESYRSIQGILEASSCSGENMFVVEEALSGKLVQCVVRDDLIHDAKKAIGRDANVFGGQLVSRDGKHKAIMASRMRVLAREEDLPTIAEMKGIYPDMTGGLPSEVYVKKRLYGEGCAP